MSNETKNQDLSADEQALLNELLAEELNDVPGFGEQRRYFLKQLAAAGAAVFISDLFGNEIFAGSPSEFIEDLPPYSMENAVKVSFKVNGISKTLTVDSRMTLLDALRERMQLTGSKKGCDHGQCGACTVLVDGRRVLSCLTLAATSEGKSVTTIEGLAKAGKLHPMQAAFLKHDGFQCGFCTPGQICSAVALMDEAKSGEASYLTPELRRNLAPLQLSDEEIRERMSGNICRCGAYPNILAAVREVHTGKDVAQSWLFADENNSVISRNAD